VLFNRLNGESQVDFAAKAVYFVAGRAALRLSQFTLRLSTLI